MRLEPVTGGIGAEVREMDFSVSVGEQAAEELRRALDRYLVLFVRDQRLDDRQHRAIAAQLGPPNVYPVTRARGLDEPLEFIDDGPDSPPKADLWHTDAAFLPEPPDLAMLCHQRSPPSGGDTLWCNLYAAYDELSPPLARFVDDLEQDLHPGETFRRAVEQQFGGGIYEQVAEEFSGCRHPLVRVHPETGRRALYLCGAYVRGIVGLSAEESDLVYGHLRRQLDDPNLQCRWRWREHDVAIWDERCTNHRALSDHHPGRRRVRRCTIGAARPIGPREAASPDPPAAAESARGSAA